MDEKNPGINLIVYLDVLGPLLALPFYLFKSKGRSVTHLLLLGFLLLQLLANSFTKILMLLDKNNIYVYQINAFFSCLIVSTYILQNLKKICTPKIFYSLRLYAFASYLVLLIIILWEDTSSSFNSLSYTFTVFTICLFCIVFYLLSLTNLNEENLIRSTRFWAITSFFLYFSINFFIFNSYKIFTILNIKEIGGLWGIHNFVLFVSCFLLIIASKYR